MNLAPLRPGAWTGIDWSDPAARLHQDPYLAWAELSGFAAMGGQGALDAQGARVIVELDAVPAVELDARLTGAGLGQVNPLYCAAGMEALRFCTASVKPGFFSGWRALGVKRYALCEPRVPTDLPAVPMQPLQFLEQARTPLVGVIDDGIPFLHSAYRTGNRSRFVSYWDQGRPPAAGGVLSRSRINALLGGFTPGLGDMVNEQHAYADLGYARLSDPQQSLHGAAVLGLAAAGTAHDIACVQLPWRTVADASGGSLAAQVLDALHFILASARGDQPVVINLSYGGYAGPHDGHGFLEAAMQDLLAWRTEDFAIVLAAGNAYQSQCHARIDLPAGARGQLGWSVPYGDRTDSYVEVWGPQAATHPGFRVGIQLPSSMSVGWVGPGEAQMVAAGGAAPGCMVWNSVSPANGRHHALIAIAPTASSSDPARAVAPYGDWTLSFEALGEGTVLDVWVERDDNIPGHDTGAVQSALFDVPGARFVEPSATLNNVAHARNCVVVGAYVRDTGEPSGYTSEGCGGRLSARVGPDVSAPGDTRSTYDGIPVTGHLSGRPPQTMCGTSVAAPQVTRMVADFLASVPAPVSVADMRAWIIGKAHSDEARHTSRGEPALPAARSGAGRLDTP